MRSTAVVCSVFAAVLSLTLSLSAGSADSLVTVPNLVGLDQDIALELIGQMDLHYDVAFVNTCEIKNSVTSQQPAEGTRVPPKSLVIVWVNRDDGVLVPELKNKSFKAAQAALKEIGLQARLKEQALIDGLGSGECYDNQEKGQLIDQVISTIPPAGSLICRMNRGQPTYVDIVQNRVWHRYYYKPPCR